MTEPRRLSALDASFLHLERDGFPMHVGSVSTFEGAPLRDGAGRIRIGALRQRIAARLPESARWRLEHPVGRGRAYWVGDDRFDLANHILEIRLEPPGDERQLMQLTAKLHERLLDRRRPLWEMWIVDGLAEGRVAMVEKIHHALVDGLGGVDLATAVLDLSPDTGEDDEVAPAIPARRNAPSRLAITYRETEARARQLASLVTTPVRAAAHLDRTRAGLEVILNGLRTFVADPFAPASSLNAAAGRHRAFAAFRCSLDDAKAIKASHGGTVNDVVLAVVAGALRAVLGETGRPLHVLVPVSERPDEERGETGNRVAAMIVALPTNEADRRARYETIKATTASMKASGEATFTGSLLRGADVLPELVAALVARLVHRQPFVNVVVTNVPGPPIPLYFAGSRMLEAIPVVPLAGNLTLSIGILSYAGQLNVGLMGDAERWPDLSIVVDALDAEFSGLLQTVYTHRHREAS